MPRKIVEKLSPFTRKILCLVAGTVTIVIIACHVLAFYAPTASGASLIDTIEKIDNIAKKDFVLNPPVAKTIYQVTRHSRADIAARDIDRNFISSLLDSGQSDTTSTLEIAALQQEQLALSIFDTSTNTCTIYASAQTFDTEKDPYGLLKTLVVNAEDRWLYLLLHERAHCDWNATLKMEEYLLRRYPDQNIYQMRPYKLAQYLGEAYADAATAIVLRSEFPATAPALINAVCHWRNLSTAKGMTHRTHHSLLSFSGNATNKNVARANSELTHHKALNSALVGMYYWLAEQGINDDQILRDLISIQPVTLMNPSATIAAAKDIGISNNCG